MEGLLSARRCTFRTKGESVGVGSWELEKPTNGLAFKMTPILPSPVGGVILRRKVKQRKKKLCGCYPFL